MIRKMLLVLGLLALALASLVPAQAATTVVGTDPADDWGAEFDPEADPLGGPLGQDLVSASITTGGDTVVFTIGVTMLPGGGIPELSRYVWALDVNGAYAELDGKFTNYSRGTCDPTSGACPPPRDPGMSPFFVRGDCDTSGQVVTCREIGKVQASFDEASATISIPVPAAMLGDSDCLTIGPGLNSSFSATVTAIPSAFVSTATTPHDTMEVSETPVSTC